MGMGMVSDLPTHANTIPVGNLQVSATRSHTRCRWCLHNSTVSHLLSPLPLPSPTPCHLLPHLPCCCLTHTITCTISCPMPSHLHHHLHCLLPCTIPAPSPAPHHLP